MWLYPKVLGYNPSERWGHSACFSGGLMYVFGVRVQKSLVFYSESMSFSFFMHFPVLTSELFMILDTGLASFMVSEFLISLTF